MKRLGVHPLLATVFLIAITIAGAAFVYNIFMGQAGAAGKSATVDFVRLNLTKSDVACMFSATVKNTGNVEITSCTVGLRRDDGFVYSWDYGAMAPGQQKGAVWWVEAGQFTIGKKYPVWVYFTSADGGSFSVTTTVTCIAG